MPTQYVDVAVVGAGISGICAAYHLQTQCPDLSYTILEGRDQMGGTWDLFRYPGIRSDSDMYTLGFPFYPWKDSRSIAAGGTILEYLEETASAFGIDQNIEYGQRVEQASWDSNDALWTLTIRNQDQRSHTVQCRFWISCCGYYRYDKGYTPDIPGVSQFKGTMIHPQQWPEGFDYSDKNVVVIGSGATAVTLVPSMADRAGHVTMLQRSPTYVLSMPGQDVVADLLEKLLPADLVSRTMRWKNVLSHMGFYQLARKRPGFVKKLLRMQLQSMLGKDYDIDTHFTPTYDPWDQRVCLVPDGDLFKAIKDGKVDVVTDHIDSIEQSGIRLKSGGLLRADVIVTATGLELLPVGGVSIRVDGAEVNLADTMGYRGVMLSGLPNFGNVVGYTNASWTLKADLSCDYLCRLINYMQERDLRSVQPVVGADVEPEPFIDLNSGYVLRALDKFPKQGSRSPWKLYQNYILDLLVMRLRPIHDRALVFDQPAQAPGRADDSSGLSSPSVLAQSA